jgi:uncharacterized circularly permuted ATP-grasp superfamily protein
MLEFHDEFFSDGGNVRNNYIKFHKWFIKQGKKSLQKRILSAENIFRKSGITFNVYETDESNEDEKLIPFDIIPRIISSKEWKKIEDGISQRVKALNLFLVDIYNSQKILKDKILPKELILNNKAFLPQMLGIKVPNNIYAHISGIDLIKTSSSSFYVLEDNLRVPSGVSYMLENRETMMHLFPELFLKQKIIEVDDYPQELTRCLTNCAPNKVINEPSIALLTPGIYNSAYFEHTFLADQISAELVQSSDLIIHNGKICMRTIYGLKPVDIIYRRVDDLFLDPLSFLPTSLLGIPGLMEVYRSGGITIANAPGTGIADDKAVYSYIPEIIKYYLDEHPILKNIETFKCGDKGELEYVLKNLDKLVVKEVHGSGGKGMLIGPAASKKEIENFRLKLISKPNDYIAQPTIALSTCQTITKSGLAPRHVDLRPFALMFKNKIKVTPGGLTRVALKKGSLIVNSSQGGGTKDTWIIED